MADIAKSGIPSLATLMPNADQQLTLPCGEAIAAGDACYVKNDGKIWRSTGTAVAPAAKVRGLASKDTKVGEACTIMWDVRFRYGAALTPGADIFLSATVGAIADAATTGGTAPIGYVVDATRIHIYGSRY